MAPPRLAQLVTPTRSTIVFAGLFLLAQKAQIRVPSTVKLLLGVLFALNWPNWPFGWHWRVYWRVLLRARLEKTRAALGWHAGDQGGRSKELGLAKAYWHQRGLGISPFAAVSYISGTVGWAQSDLFLHKSNSCYLASMDEARFDFGCKHFEGPMHNEGFVTLLGGTSTVYLTEIPMFATWQIETRIAAYDDRWVFIVTFFTIPAGKHPSSRDVVLATPSGPQILCCIGLSKVVCKIRGERQTIKPSRLMSAAGFGPDASNWQRMQEKRAQKTAKAWLMSNDGPDGLEPFQEHNERVLQVIGRLGGGEQKKVWLELLEVVRSCDGKPSSG